MVLFYSFRIFRRLRLMLHKFYCNIITFLLLKANKVKFGKNFVSNGSPTIDVENGGVFLIGDNVKINNGSYYNRIGRQQRSGFIVTKKGYLSIGSDVGMSCVYIVCHNRVEIGSNVKLGGNVVIYDTDFHSLDPLYRRNSIDDKNNTRTKPVLIGNDTFVGAHTIILKGVTIGENSIVGAGSVVTKSIPANEIWGGNPAKFIRKL